MTSMFHIYVAILLFFIKGSCGNDVDLSKISYTIIEELTEKFIKFSLDSKDWQIMLSCVSCEVKEDLSINCKGDETLKVNVELKKGDISFIVPYNVSCDNKNDHVTRDLTSTSTIESIELVWTKSDLSINTYIISFFESYKYEHKIIITNDSKYTLKDLKEKTLYRMCIATINNQYITGKYMCIDKLTDFAETGPVEAIVITPSSDSAEVSWKKPLNKEDNPEGYVVQYSEQSRKCGIVFISMGLSRMKETGSCDIKKHEAWVDLESLKLTNLKPYTKYSVIIYPINGNKIINEKKDEFQTKEGESGPVSNINKEFVKDWLRINFDKPKNENGVVTKYKINLIQQRLGICKNINKEIFSKSNFTGNSNYIINSNEMEKCAEYRVEIYPINGWSHNSGIGQMAYITFKYEAETTLSVSKLDAKFISSNMIRISWEDPVEQEHCKEISYLVKVMNKENKDYCKNLIIYNQTCKEFITITLKDSNCDLKEVFPEKIRHSSTIYYGNDFKSNLYEISVSKITFSSHLQKNPSRIVKLKEDCFTDCYSSTYKGIRSDTGCIRWKDSPTYSNYYTGNNFFCQMASLTTPWCPTKESWKKCEVPKCSKIITSSECVKDIRSDISTTKIDLSWTSPYYKDAVIGFITLVYGRDNTCEQCHVQLCEKCPSEAQLSSQIKNFYTFCKTTETRYINNKATLNNLNNDEDYIVFIITLLSINLAGSVKQSSFRTLLAKPGIPQNVKVVTKSTTFITFIWDKLTKTADKGLPEYYESILYESQSKKNVQKTNYENVYFSGLNMCTKYCLHVYATNKAGNSKDKGYICDYTYAPGLGEVKVNNIDDEPSSYREISWLYSKDDPCHKSYRVIYKDIFSSTHTAVEINSTRTIIKHLTLNTFYTVTVRAESQLQTSNNQSLGKYSDEVRFYTGKVRPDIKDYKENILAQRTKVNISWSFDNSSNGSIFQFIVIIQNSSKHCLNLVNLICKDCPPQYSVKNLNEQAKKIKTQLLKCEISNGNYKKEYTKDRYTLSHLFNMNIPLNTFSVEIYAINLKGIHKVFDQISSYKEDFLSKETFLNFKNMKNDSSLQIKCQDPNVKILQRNPQEVTLQCILGKLVNLEVELRSNNNVINVPFNMSCGMKHLKNIIKNLANKLNGKVHKLVWNVTTKGIYKYIIIWMNKDGHFKKYVETELTSYSLKTSKEYNWQQICIATIDNTWRTSKYTCTLQSLSPGTIFNLKSYSTSKEVYIVWQKSEEDVHHGYLIIVFHPSGLCNSTIINMEPYCVKLKTRCRYFTKIYLRFLRSFEIKDLAPDRKYKISISSVKGNYTSKPTIVMIKTKREESVTNLKIRNKGSHVQVTFIPPGTKTSKMVYRLKLTLRGLNICTFKYKVLYDNVIINTSKLIPVYFSVSCFEYEVEVVPVRQCKTNGKFTDDPDIEYTPLKVKGSFNNVTTDVLILSNIHVSLLSINLLKVSWSNYIINNECSNFGFIVDIHQVMNKSDCKSWIIATTTCSILKNELSQFSNCQNKEYLSYDNVIIKSYMLLLGQFEANKVYKLKIWKIEKNVNLVKETLVKYEYDGGCISDCQRKNVKINNDDCEIISNKIPSTHYKYPYNICMMESNSVVLFCYNKDSGHKAQCNTTNCVSTMRNDQCAQNIRIFSYKTSITIKLPDILQKKSIKGFILVLYDLNKTCIKLNKININVTDMSALSFHSDCKGQYMIKGYNNTSTFTDLQPHQQYFIYIYPFLDEEVFGVISHLTVATIMSSPMTNYIEVIKRTNTSLTFKWNSYKEKNKIRPFNQYQVYLQNTRSNEELSVNISQEVTTFDNLEACTSYCMFLTVEYKENSLELVDSTCVHTLSSNLGILITDNIKSGPISTRDISWTYSGSEDCPKTYVVEIYNKNTNLTVYKNTIDTKISINDLEIKTTYRVIVGIMKETLLNNDVDNVNYSDMQVFYTGTVNETISVEFIHLDPTRKILMVIWTSEYTNWIRIFEYIIQIRNNAEECLVSIAVSPSSTEKDYQPLLSKKLIISWEKYKKCRIKLICTYKLKNNIIMCKKKFEKAFPNSTLVIYGMNVLEVKELYNQLI